MFRIVNFFMMLVFSRYIFARAFQRFYTNIRRSKLLSDSFIGQQILYRIDFFISYVDQHSTFNLGLQSEFASFEKCGCLRIFTIDDFCHACNSFNDAFWIRAIYFFAEIYRVPFNNRLPEISKVETLTFM